jgi:DNA-binding transcriptional MerR regulator
MKNDNLVPIGYAARALNLPAHHVRVHAQELGLKVHRTMKGHRRYDLDEIRQCAERMKQERLVELARMLPL